MKRSGFSYRHSGLPADAVVTRVEMALQAADSGISIAELTWPRCASGARDHQPINQPSCGSVFRNPDGDSAGRLIEAAGLKGHTIGGAQISLRHANFITVTPGASAADVHALIRLAQDRCAVHPLEWRYGPRWSFAGFDAGRRCANARARRPAVRGSRDGHRRVRGTWTPGCERVAHGVRADATRRRQRRTLSLFVLLLAGRRRIAVVLRSPLFGIGGIAVEGVSRDRARRPSNVRPRSNGVSTY